MSVTTPKYISKNLISVSVNGRNVTIKPSQILLLDDYRKIQDFRNVQKELLRLNKNKSKTAESLYNIIEKIQ